MLQQNFDEEARSSQARKSVSSNDEDWNVEDHRRRCSACRSCDSRNGCPCHIVRVRLTIGDAASIGMFSFGVNNFFQAMYLLNVGGAGFLAQYFVTTLLCGTLQTVCGLLSLATCAKFPPVALSVYGLQWMVLGANGLLAVLTNGDELTSPAAIGLTYAVWLLFTLLMLVETMRVHLISMTLFILVAIKLAFLCFSGLWASARVVAAGFAVAVGLTAFYCSFAGFTNLIYETDYLPLPRAETVRKRRS